MAMKKLKRVVWRAARPLALQLLRHTGTFDVTWRSLRKLRDRGLKVQFAIDGGAATGEWTLAFKKLYKDAQVLCVEPRDSAQAELKDLAKALSGVQLAQTLLGDKDGEVEFHEHDDQSSMLKNASGKAFGVSRKAPITTLDGLLRSRSLPAPDLIKLDLQGAELMCLRGAKESLKHTQLVILELLIIPLYKGAPTLADTMSFMQEQGFRCYDVLSLWHRPLDGALAFGDFVFIKDTHALVSDSRWSAAEWES